MSYRRSFKSYGNRRAQKEAPEYDQVLMGSIVLTADAHNKVEIDMPKKLREGYYPVLKYVEVSIDTDQIKDLDADDEFLCWELNEEEETALLEIDDEECVAAGGFVSAAHGTAANVVLWPRYERVDMHRRVYVNDSIWFAALSDAAGTLRCRIHYTIKKIDDWLVNRLLKKT